MWLFYSFPSLLCACPVKNNDDEHSLFRGDDGDAESTPPRLPRSRISNDADMDGGDTSSSESIAYATGEQRRSSRIGARRSAALQPSALMVVHPKRRVGRPSKRSHSASEVTKPSETAGEVTSTEADATSSNHTPSKGRNTARKNTPKRLSKQQLEANNMAKFWEQVHRNSQGQLKVQSSESPNVFNVFAKLKSTSLGKDVSNQFASSISLKM